MKKILSISLFALLANGVFAQVADAVMFKDQGKIDEAKKAIDKAVLNEKQKLKARTWYTKGLIYNSISTAPLPAYRQLDTNAVVTAYEAFLKASEVEPESKDAKKAQEEVAKLYIPVSYRMFQLKDYENSVKVVDKGLAANAKDTTLALIGGYSSQNLKKYNEAGKYYEQYLNNGGGDVNVRYSLIQIYKQEKNYDKALAVSKQALEKYPDNEELGKEVLNLYLSTGKTDEAIASTEELLKKSPKNALFSELLGQLYMQKKDEAKAVSYYERALEQDPASFNVNYNLGVIHYNRGAIITQKINDKPVKIGQADPRVAEVETHFKKALPYFEKANQAKAGEIDVLKPLSTIYKQLKRPDDEKRINKLIENL
jgi:tetratricopeptide (TPR) repeat protein